DITEGEAGVPLALGFHVLNAQGCTPLQGARVDVWHADAIGLYSGYARQTREFDISTTGKTFLRGTQISGPMGEGNFRTIYPGWYLGRTVHLHFKVFVGAKEMVTSQMYFPERINNKVLAQAPYNKRKAKRDVTNDTDFNLRLAPATGVICDIAPKGAGYSAS